MEGPWTGPTPKVGAGICTYRQGRFLLCRMMYESREEAPKRHYHPVVFTLVDITATTPTGGNIPIVHVCQDTDSERLLVLWEAAVFAPGNKISFSKSMRVPPETRVFSIMDMLGFSGMKLFQDDTMRKTLSQHVY